MRRRLYCLLPHARSARAIVDELLLARIDERHIHLLARDDIRLDGLPQANLLQRSDLFHGIEVGLIAGGLTGAAAGVAAAFVLVGAIHGGVILGCAIAGALIGAWASGIISTDVRSTRLRPFEAAIGRGEILLMVDAPKERVQEIEALLRRHREAHLGGEEPTIPAFP